MRLDLALVQRNLYSTRARAVAAIKAGLVLINGVPAKKPSQDVVDSDVLDAGALPYSSGRGSLKLERALEYFKINPENMVCLDVGASTGGFTEVLLNHGAARVYAVDVGTNQLIPELRENPRVVSLEQTDIRALPVQSVVDLIVIDVSFISLTNIVGCLHPWGAKTVVALIKPQFEVAREVAAKCNGVIKSLDLHQESINRVVNVFKKCGFKSVGVTESPVKGGSGNTEFLVCFKVK
ncbi:MAG: TlyA family RNA methyltransferase [Alphaproteobacteria bacterium]|nr:TlyA family RNA methyltransferase [Alphaproteobacteria bacterium]